MRMNIEEVLKKNDGYTDKVYFKDRNFEEEQIYTITDGKLIKKSIGKNYIETFVCDMPETRRFLYFRRFGQNKIAV